MKTLIVSWYDGGYCYDVRFLKVPKILKERDKDNFISCYKKISELYYEELTKDFVKIVFEQYVFIDTIIICEDGGIEVYTRKEGRIE